MVDYWPFPPIDLREPWIDPKPQVFLFGGAPARPSTGKSAADPLGLDRRVIRELIAELGPHEFLYIGDGRIYRVEG
jgi:hypothetical protein